MKLKFTNPNPNASQPDPFILEDNGEVYIFATGGNGVNCYKANELMGCYEYQGLAFVREGFKEYWAPEVIKIDDTFYMYVSCMKKESEDVHEQAIMVATSKEAGGPYNYVCDLIAPFSIDAHPVLNESGLYLFYCLNDYESEKAGTRIVVDKMITPTQMAGNPKVVVAPSIEQEIFMKDRFKKGQDWFTIEGACYFEENGYQYLLYSANCYQNEYYFVGYSVCKSNELDLTKVDFKKYPSDDVYAPLLSKNHFEGGTGHNSLIKYNGDWYIVYHGRDLYGNDVDYDNRTMRIAKVVIEGEKLSLIREE